MKKIVSIGCSFTFGHGLSDIHHSPEWFKTPSKLVWSHLVSKHYRTEHENLSQPGASNDYICRNFIEHSSSNQDLKSTLYLLMWSDITRTEVLFGNHWVRLGSWMTRTSHSSTKELPTVLRNFCRLFYGEIYSDSYGANNFEKNAYLAQTHAEIQNINVEFYSFRKCKSYGSFPAKQPNAFFNNFVEDLADDNSHFGPVTHRKFANKVIDDVGKYF